MKRLIVNADDYGRTPGVNAGVLEAHAGGFVTSATVMVLEPSAARGIRDAAERGPKLSLGVHFTLTGGGPPAAAARAVPTLAPGGRFPRRVEELPPRIPEAEIRAELQAQIEIFCVLARRPPSHLDSHHHAARHPDVARVFAAVARERSLPVRAVDDPDRRALREAGVRTPDRFFGDFYGPDASFATLERILGSLEDGVSELMCHPARIDDALRRGSSYADERDLEREVLCDAKLLPLVRSLGVELVGFDRLGRMR
ncbi:MAG TPA: ChbG/HpnK family deacetylase [Thermoanaerobaculia bacterium]|nr:ChbG/HpnK family deacetylase [Thermoanaerobaculia bacterium]